EPRAARCEGRQVVMRLEGDSLLIDGALTLATVPALAAAVRDHLRQGVRVIDFRGVTEVDSSAVALALEWLRQAAEGGGALRLANLPAAVQNLAKLYGGSGLLQPAASRSAGREATAIPPRTGAATAN